MKERIYAEHMKTFGTQRRIHWNSGQTSREQI